MKIEKILLGLLILFLLIGTVSAFDVDSLKNIDDCTKFDDGFSNYTTHINRYFMVVPIQEYSAFENATDVGHIVKDVGDNIFYFEEGVIGVMGYQELVEIDGETYYVSVYQHSKLSPSEEKELLDDLIEFNKVNNFEPIEMSVT